MFLWHFPSGCPARPLAGIVALWSPDFPLRVRKRAATTRRTSSAVGLYQRAAELFRVTPGTGILDCSSAVRYNLMSAHLPELSCSDSSCSGGCR